MGHTLPRSISLPCRLKVAPHPSLAAPYWEYTLDSKLYGDAWTRFSPVFSDDFFGVFPVEAPFTVSTGGVPWGYLMDNFASDETAYVTRAASMCGLPTTAPLPTLSWAELGTVNLVKQKRLLISSHLSRLT